MIIPDKIKILGQTFEVIWCDDLTFTEDAKGAIYYREQKIRLQRPSIAQPWSRESIEESVIHELVHAILHVMDCQLNEDENFVGLFARLFYAVLKDNGLLADEKQA